MEVVERVFEKRLRRIVSADEMQLSLMPEKGIIDAVFIMKRMQEEYHAKGNKLYICFCGPRESICLSNKESVAMGFEEERNTTSFG